MFSHVGFFRFQRHRPEASSRDEDVRTFRKSTTTRFRLRKKVMLSNHTAYADQSTKNRDLESRIMNCLRLHSPQAEQIEVVVQDDSVILRGVVLSESIKWQCHECCRHVAGVLNVIDELVVSLSRSNRHAPLESFLASWHSKSKPR